MTLNRAVRRSPSTVVRVGSIASPPPCGTRARLSRIDLRPGCDASLEDELDAFPTDRRERDRRVAGASVHPHSLLVPGGSPAGATVADDSGANGSAVPRRLWQNATPSLARLIAWRPWRTGGPHEDRDDRARRRGRQTHRPALSEAVPPARWQATHRPRPREGAGHRRHRPGGHHLPRQPPRRDAQPDRQARVR